MRKDDVRPPVDLNRPVENPALVAAINNLAHDTSDKVKDVLLAELNKANYLVAIFSDEMHTSKADQTGKAVIEKDSIIKVLNTSDAEGNTYLPLFTDWDAIRKYIDKPVDTLVIPAGDAWSWVLNMGDYHGAVINPANNALPLNKDQIKYLYGQLNQNEVKMTHHDQISKALNSLLQRANDDSFVIFEDVKTKKYVQFASSKNEQLLLDLPLIALTPDELERAEKLFSEYNAKPVESPVSNYKGGPITGTSKEFVMKLGNDVKKATEITTRIFKEVYLLESDFNLGKEEN